MGAAAFRSANGYATCDKPKDQRIRDGSDRRLDNSTHSTRIARMTRRRSGTNWSWLRWLIESNLRRHPGFQKNFRLEEKIRLLGSGLFHKTYLFEASGKHLVLRFGIVERDLQTRRKAATNLRQEAKTLRALRTLDLSFAVPELICLANDESGETVGLIETAVGGMPLSFLTRRGEPEDQLKIIAQVAAAVHALAKSEFTHLDQHADSQAHVMANLKALPDSLFKEFPEAANAQDWILSQLPNDRPSTVLHGDLLPQNLLFEIRENGETAVVDWESAQIGDPAYDLAIVTRGVRKPLGISGGLQRLVQFYNEAAEDKISADAVLLHELLLHLDWLAEAVAACSRNHLGGHGPEHYATALGGIVRRARASQKPH
jgi:aminoglycoside phosphotransferase (APT) family kinase protein